MNAAAFKADCHVAVIGAGPYGLAVTAHLKAARVDVRLFGDPMGFWRRNMPKGMKLRSPWRASHIADRNNSFSLDQYAKLKGIKRTEPFPLEEFVRYGQWFQQQAVPDLDERKVDRVEAVEAGFLLHLNDGTSLRAKKVIVAMGFANQAFRPEEFERVPSDLASHSSDHANFDAFCNKRVVVIGRGQSACESAVLLSEAGAEVELISRGDIRWIGPENPGEALRRDLKWIAHGLLTSTGAVGPFPLNWLVDVPGIVSMLPSHVRDRLAIRSLRPAATAWLKPRAVGVQFNFGRKVVNALGKGSKLTLQLDDGTSSQADHVLLATGYRTDIAKLGIFTPGVLNRIQRANGAPILSAGLESSMPGLHFAGSSAMKSFGPLMRFVWGAGYAARSVTRSVLSEKQPREVGRR